MFREGRPEYSKKILQRKHKQRTGGPTIKRDSIHEHKVIDANNVPKLVKDISNKGNDGGKKVFQQFSLHLCKKDDTKFFNIMKVHTPTTCSNIEWSQPVTFQKEPELYEKYEKKVNPESGAGSSFSSGRKIGRAKEVWGKRIREKPWILEQKTGQKNVIMRGRHVEYPSTSGFVMLVQRGQKQFEVIPCKNIYDFKSTKGEKIEALEELELRMEKESKEKEERLDRIKTEAKARREGEGKERNVKAVENTDQLEEHFDEDDYEEKFNVESVKDEPKMGGKNAAKSMASMADDEGEEDYSFDEEFTDDENDNDAETIKVYGKKKLSKEGETYSQLLEKEQQSRENLKQELLIKKAIKSEPGTTTASVVSAAQIKIENNVATDSTTKIKRDAVESNGASNGKRIKVTSTEPFTATTTTTNATVKKENPAEKVDNMEEELCRFINSKKSATTKEIVKFMKGYTGRKQEFKSLIQEVAILQSKLYKLKTKYEIKYSLI